MVLANLVKLLSKRSSTFAACAIVACVACDTGGDVPQGAAPSVIPPAASAPPVAPAKARAPKLSFEEMVSKSQPLSPKPEAQQDGPKKLTAERCTLEGRTFLGKSTMDVFKAIEVVGDRLLLVDHHGTISGFKIDTKGGCSLRLDESFGEAGMLKLPEKVEHLSRTSAGRVFASNGIFAAYAIKDGKQEFKCDTKGHVEIHSGGKWGIAPWVNATVRLVKVEPDKCSSEDWVLKELNDDQKREGPFSNVNSSAVAGDLVLIGGVLAKSEDPKQSRVVIGYDKAGKQKIRFGGELSAKDGFGWVHAIEPCPTGICVLDSNLRRVSIWTRAGKHVATVELGKLFDLAYPWLPDFTVAKDGSAWFAAAQTRGSSGVAEGLVYRVRGL